MDHSAYLTGLRLIATGAGVTVAISLCAIAIGFAIALPVCAANMSGSRIARLLGHFYVSFFRGVPLLVLLLLIYYLLPFVGLELPSFAAAALGLGVCTAAYQAENLRGGFLIIPAGQREAALAFSYSRYQSWRHILLPQAIRAAMPMMVNEMIAILKASSLVSVVGVADMTRVAQNIVARDVQPLLWYPAIAFIYLAINLTLAHFSHRSVGRLRRGRPEFRL
ncbi:amino acid ABC transporter permease [Ancylobacter sp. MQZ15Z-1]|uniref:Amino acid ABC transporter permease n=1 Tax=Ancylobacter mangrovi TaxID=2972472 RepID=A0A9X2PA01_9HYPH|nr:amino acid ABC transporter permease [Ancylobacter mangrovi]MCS0494786.1 amino acid ABC transporter permease [Ancylobacter mangrovi]